MEHVMFIQKVKEDKKEEYIKAHEACWKELLFMASKLGIKREMIWIYEKIVIVYIMAKDFDKSMNELAKTKIFKKWLKKF